MRKIGKLLERKMGCLFFVLNFQLRLAYILQQNRNPLSKIRDQPLMLFDLHVFYFTVNSMATCAVTKNIEIRLIIIRTIVVEMIQK